MIETSQDYIGIGLRRTRNGRNFRPPYLSIHRRQRSARFGWEWRNHAGTRYLNVYWGDPRVHRCWAASATLYLTHGR